MSILSDRVLFKIANEYRPARISRHAEGEDAAGGREPTEEEVKLKPWMLHDLRRTFSTWANENGIEPHVVEACLNHVSGAAKRGGAASCGGCCFVPSMTWR